MKQRPASRFSSAVVSLLAIAAWLVASNHCVVAGLMPAPQMTQVVHEHCSGHATPQKQKPTKGGCDQQNCCKSLSVPATAVAKSPVGYDDACFGAKNHPAIDLPFSGEQHAAPIWEVDTGPPAYGASFAESVLQRSLQAHAPPVLA